MSQGQTGKCLLFPILYEEKNEIICEILTMKGETSFLFMSSGDILVQRWKKKKKKGRGESGLRGEGGVSYKLKITASKKQDLQPHKDKPH